MKFTFNLNLLIQVIGVAIQGLTMATNLLPDASDHKEVIVLVVALLQSLSALVAHFKNPDGESAAKPYKG